jgi:trimethylamine--corrinoid protein Co-methyltransferase
MVVPNKKVLDLLGKHGAQIDYDKKNCKLPRTLVEEFVRKVPSTVVFGARSPKNRVVFEKGRTPPLFATNLGATYINDLETRERREGTLRDVEECNRVVDALPNINFGSGEVVIPSDVDPRLSQYYSWIAAFKNTSKHIVLYQSGSQAVKVALEMATAILGDMRKLKDNPIMSFWASLPEVLGFEESLLNGINEAALNRIPMMIEAGPASGATGPGTIAGTFVLSNAELIGAFTIIQILNPGTPVVYSNWARHFDMKAENVALASPEITLMRICAGQMAKYYNIPSGSTGLSTDSKLLDVQAGYDKSIALIAILSGNDIVFSDSMDGGDMEDPAELVINDEMAANYLRVWKGLEINDRTLAVEEIKSVGPGLGHNFLGTKFTLENFRKETWLGYRISERRKWALWNKDGAKSAEKKAADVAKQILKNHNPDPISNDILGELTSIVRRVEHK